MRYTIIIFKFVQKMMIYFVFLVNMRPSPVISEITVNSTNVVGVTPAPGTTRRRYPLTAVRWVALIFLGSATL
jgi:hypothetical protein